MELKNTYVLRTDDDNFRKAIDRFLIFHCNTKDVNAAIYELSEPGAKEVMAVVNEIFK